MKPTPRESKITTILFDLDGTLVDTEPAAAAAINECLSEWGIPADPSDAAVITGRTWATAFDFLFKKYPLPLPAQEAGEAMLTRYRLKLETHLRIVPGSAQAVAALAERYPLALVSGSHRSEIIWALDRLNVRHHFQFILGAEDYPRSKPAPDGYLKALEMLRAKAENTLIFEDSSAGIQSALAAGTQVVAITGTNHFNQDVSLAHHRIPDLTGVTPEWVKSIF